MLIRLDEHYTKYANGISEHEVAGNTIKECVQALLNRYPQLYVHMVDNDHQMCLETSISFNDELVVSPADTDKRILPASNNCIDIRRDIPEGAEDVVRWIGVIVLAVFAVVFYVLSVFNPTFTILGTYLSEIAVALAVSAVVSAVVTAIMVAFFTPDSPAMAGPNFALNSASYTFEGAQNTTAIGTAIPVVYGTHRVGGHWLNIYTTHEEERKIINDVETSVHSSYLYGQLGMCEGEIAGISDVMINRLPLNFYDEVTTIPDGNYIRLGEPVQSPMADFTYTQNSVSIGRKISVANPPISAVPVSYTSATPVYGVVEVELDMHGDSRTTIKRGFYSPSYRITQY